MNGGKSAANRVAFLLSLREVREFRPGPVPRCVIDDVLEVARLIWQRPQQTAVGDRHPGPGDARRSGGRRGLRGPPGGRRSRIVPVMAGEREGQEAYEEGTCARGSCSPPGRAASAPPSGGSSGASPRRNTFSALRRGGGQDHNFSGLPEGRCAPRTGLDAQTALGDPLRGALWCLA
jgi:hypothetical protein